MTDNNKHMTTEIIEKTAIPERFVVIYRRAMSATDAVSQSSQQNKAGAGATLTELWRVVSGKEQRQSYKLKSTL